MTWLGVPPPAAGLLGALPEPPLDDGALAPLLVAGVDVGVDVDASVMIKPA